MNYFALFLDWFMSDLPNQKGKRYYTKLSEYKLKE